MRGVKQFDEFIRMGVVKKQAPDKSRSRFLIIEAEQDYDYLQFYIDGNKQGEWSGIDNSWSFVSFPVTVGNHDLQWEYDKDSSADDGQDCAWLDYIVGGDLRSNSNIVPVERYVEGMRERYRAKLYRLFDEYKPIRLGLQRSGNPEILRNIIKGVFKDSNSFGICFNTCINST